MVRIIYIVLFIIISGMNSLWGQTKVNWEILANVTYDYIQNQDQNLWYGKPNFSEEIQALDGKQIMITGYILPSDASTNTYVLSAFPFSSCFFCGGAGPESIIELNLQKRKEKFKQDQVVTFVGTLRLNARELEMNYILEEAEVANTP